MQVMSTLILLSPLLQGYCLYTLTTLSCFVCLLFVCTLTTMSYDLFVKLIGLDLLLIIALANTQTSGCSSCRWRRRRRQRCRPSPQQRSPQVSPGGACPKFGASFLIFCFDKKGDKIRPNLRQNPVEHRQVAAGEIKLLKNLSKVIFQLSLSSLQWSTQLFTGAGSNENQYLNNFGWRIDLCCKM